MMGRAREANRQPIMTKFGLSRRFPPLLRLWPNNTNNGRRRIVAGQGLVCRVAAGLYRGCMWCGVWSFPTAPLSIHLHLTLLISLLISLLPLRCAVLPIGEDP